MFCSPPLLLTPKDNQLLGMVVTCGPSLGPSRVGPPFLLSEPNTNYFLAAAPPPHVGRGVVVGRMGRPDTGVVRDTPHLCGHGWPWCAAPSVSQHALQTHWHSSPPPLQCLSLFFFPRNPGGEGGWWGESCQGGPRERRGQALRNPLFL